jgi:hypothetical protein
VQVLGSADSTGAAVARTSTGGIVFDKARIVVTSNDTTAGVDAWLAVSV